MAHLALLSCDVLSNFPCGFVAMNKPSNILSLSISSTGPAAPGAQSHFSEHGLGIFEADTSVETHLCVIIRVPKHDEFLHYIPTERELEGK